MRYISFCCAFTAIALFSITVTSPSFSFASNGSLFQQQEEKDKKEKKEDEKEKDEKDKEKDKDDKDKDDKDKEKKEGEGTGDGGAGGLTGTKNKIGDGGKGGTVGKTTGQTASGGGGEGAGGMTGTTTKIGEGGKGGTVGQTTGQTAAGGGGEGAGGMTGTTTKIGEGGKGGTVGQTTGQTAAGGEGGVGGMTGTTTKIGEAGKGGTVGQTTGQTAAGGEGGAGGMTGTTTKIGEAGKGGTVGQTTGQTAAGGEGGAGGMTGTTTKIGEAGKGGTVGRTTGQTAAGGGGGMTGDRTLIGGNTGTVGQTGAIDPGTGAGGGGAPAISNNTRNIDLTQPVENQNWYDMAVFSFENAAESNAFKYLYGHVLTENAGFERNLAWVSGIREPRVATRWAVGIEIDASPNFSGDLPLIGDVPVLPNSRGRQNTGPAPGSSPFKGIDNKTINGNFVYYTGELGQRVLKELDERRQAQAAWGAVLKDIPGQSTEISQLAEGGGPAGGGGPQDGSATLQNTLPVGQGGAGGGAAKPDFPSVSGTLIPGVMHLGVGSSADLLNTAQQEGVDVLVVFEVSVDLNARTGTRGNTTQMKLIRVKDGKAIRNGSKLNYINVWRDRQRQKNDSRDPVISEVNKMFSVVDEGEFKMISSDMPNIDGDIAKQRVEHLASEKDGDPLVRLVEIMNYYRQGKISKSFAVSQVALLIGDENAESLFSNDEAERKSAILKWIPDTN
jgi:hypothetical protein